MPEITFIIDKLRGEILVEDNIDLTPQAMELLQADLGKGREIACARPLEIIKPPSLAANESAEIQTVRITGFYHNSLTEGPGRRSSVLFQHCPLKCPGCYVPELHSREAGQVSPVSELARLLLNPQFERDGVTILGGEPFAQSTGLLALVKELRQQGCRHIVCYSGYTLESLREQAQGKPEITQILAEIDILIDGPFIVSLARQAGWWTGSGNQRVIDMKSTREQEQTVLFQND